MLLGSLLLTAAAEQDECAAGAVLVDPGPFASPSDSAHAAMPVNPGPSPAMPPGFEPPPGIIPRSAWARLDVAAAARDLRDERRAPDHGAPRRHGRRDA